MEGPRFNVNFRFDMTIIPLRSLSLSLPPFSSRFSSRDTARAALDNELPSGSQERIAGREREGTAITRNSQVLRENGGCWMCFQP